MRSLLLSLILLFSLHSIAKADDIPKDPFMLIEQTGLSLFERIAKNRQQLEVIPDLMLDIIEQELMPIIDYKYASYKILGKHLKNTSKAQREKFVFAMRHYLVRTYASALKQYKGQEVIFEQGKVANQAKSASISASILEDKKSPVDLTFQMRKNSKTQQWKAYDLVVEGISLLTSKNAEFNSRINKFGIDQVTEELVELNQ